MTRNHKYLKKNGLAHYPKWPVIFLDTTWKIKSIPISIQHKIYKEISSKYPNSNFLKIREFKSMKNEGTILGYKELLSSQSLENSIEPVTYQNIATRIIHDWNESKEDSDLINSNYNNAVVVGVTSYFDKKIEVVYISFVYID